MKHLLRRQILPLFLAHANKHEPIQGRTRLHKIIFLIQRELKLSDDYNYIPYDYGPYSCELQSDVDEFILNGVMSEKLEELPDDKMKYIIFLRDDGIKIVDYILENYWDDFGDLYNSIERLKKGYNKKSLKSLIKEVYEKYPEYAICSKYCY